MRRLMARLRDRRGQAMTEFFIIVVVVALAASAILAVFSDTLRAKLAVIAEKKENLAKKTCNLVSNLLNYGQFSYRDRLGCLQLNSQSF